MSIDMPCSDICCELELMHLESSRIGDVPPVYLIIEHGAARIKD